MEKRFVFSAPITYTLKDTDEGPRFFVEGHASTSGVDLVNDICTANCLKSMQQQMLKRNIKLDLEHEAFRGDTQEEKELNKTIIPAGKIVEAEIDNKGLKITALINPHSPRFEQTKGNIELEMLDAFSIAFIPTKIAFTEKAGEKVRLLEDVRLLNVALTGNAINTEAQISKVFTKSIESLSQLMEEKEKNPEMADLEVKRTTRQQERNQAVSEGDSEDEETKPKNKKKKVLNALDEIKSYLTSLEEDNLNKTEDKQMESKESTKDEQAKAPEESQEATDEAKEESEESSESEPKAPAEEAPKEEATHEDIKAMKAEISSLKKEMKDLKEVKAADRKANSKALSESTNDKEKPKPEQKSQGPLSLIN